VSVESLADELIAVCHGKESIGQVYRFLAEHYDSDRARLEFIRYLRGERCELLLEAARSHVTTEPPGPYGT
jgi:hypothetical protein